MEKSQYVKKLIMLHCVTVKWYKELF